jgi:hypothetical protein
MEEDGPRFHESTPVARFLAPPEAQPRRQDPAWQPHRVAPGEPVQRGTPFFVLRGMLASGSDQPGPKTPSPLELE